MEIQHENFSYKQLAVFFITYPRERGREAFSMIFHSVVCASMTRIYRNRNHRLERHIKCDYSYFF